LGQILIKDFYYSKTPSFLKEGENGPKVRDLASEATPRILLVISPGKEVKRLFNESDDGLRSATGRKVPGNEQTQIYYIGIGTSTVNIVLLLQFSVYFFGMLTVLHFRYILMGQICYLPKGTSAKRATAAMAPAEAPETCRKY
jgi:hypothetical protein